MLDRVIARLSPQVQRIVINANGDPARLNPRRLPVVADPIEGFAGPLAGILAGMRWSRVNEPAARFLVSVAADTPFFPRDLVSRLSVACGCDEATIALAASAAGTHPVFGLWPLAVADELEESLRSGSDRKVLAFADRHIRVNVPFEDLLLPTGDRIDPFFNVNTPPEAAEADRIAAALDTIEAR
jgi:molybdopterin-guanine dinucleotide biosynthesis protein A